jgi:hypothetical protein
MTLKFSLICFLIVLFLSKFILPLLSLLKVGVVTRVLSIRLRLSEES